jgi:adenine-specific DNA-methyltransferase
MIKEQIQNLFEQRYNQDTWKQGLRNIFGDVRFFANPEILTGIDAHVATSVVQLGNIVLNENGLERTIAIFDVTLADGIVLERNRVGLRNLLRKYWKDIDAAFIAYHRPESLNWRFTYVSELTGYAADGEYVQIKTEPKRYTYVLGEGESVRTATERFVTIANKGKQTSLADVKEAFSVEKLSKSFFGEYIKQYKSFCDNMLSKPSILQTLFNGDEKGVRDFNKKLLGRVVFLYFIQKKG